MELLSNPPQGVHYETLVGNWVNSSVSSYILVQLEFRSDQRHNPSCELAFDDIGHNKLYRFQSLVFESPCSAGE